MFFKQLMGTEELIRGCILAHLNCATDLLNVAALERLIGEDYIFTSSDYFGAANQDDANIYTPQLLNKLQPPCMAPKKLYLRVDPPIILLRNLNHAKGPMNRTC